MAAASSRGRILFTAAAAAALVAALGGLVTRLDPWYYQLALPSWKPPDWLFGPAWTLIFGCTALSGYQSWTHAGRDRAFQARLLALFCINGLLNIAWSALFFRFHRPDWALLEVFLLWVSILGLIVLSSRKSVAAAWLLVPYLAWVSFAAALNYSVVRLNNFG